MYCKNCGEQIVEGAKFCGNCGCSVDDSMDTSRKGETKREVNPELSSIKESVQNIAEKAMVGASNMAERAVTGASNIVSQVSEKMETGKLNSAQTGSYQRERTASKISNDARDKSTQELWSWLKKDAKRQMFYKEDENVISESEFMECVADKMEQNDVPATMKRKKVRWDCGTVEKECYFIQPVTQVSNPVSYILQFKHVGKFSFVEEKTFITPPDLPEVPGKPKKMPSSFLSAGIAMLVIGIIFLILGVPLAASSWTRDAGGPLIVFGIIMLSIGIVLLCGLGGIITYNKYCAEQQRKWEQAWSDWQKSIFRHSFQEDINGELSRIFESVFGCIKQVSNELFDDKQFADEEISTNMNELEQIISRRKEEYR